MIGFGKPNRQVFLTSVANNQFITGTKDGVDLKPVTYHVFDKNVAENNKNLNHLYYRFKNEYLGAGKSADPKECKSESTEDNKVTTIGVDPKDYLPLPALPAVEHYHHLDINSPDFYQEIRKIVTKSAKDVNFIIVSFESDLENIDMAQKLVEKRREWGVNDLIIFVRVKKSHNNHFIFREENVYYIGNESECAYNIEAITNDKIFKMAQMRNEIYDLEYKLTHKKDFEVSDFAVLDNKENANKDWYIVKCQLERESNVYGCLSLQSKLNMMGLEYCKVDANDKPALLEEDYIKYYAVNDLPDYYTAKELPDVKTYTDKFAGKKVVKYTLNFRESRRKNFAVLEHYRWNSFMLSKGVVPSTKEQIRNETFVKNGELRHTNGKNYRLRRHGNLTTFEGLVEFRKMVAKREDKDETEFDVIKYDYQLLDDAYWFLSQNGFKIVRRGDCKDLSSIKPNVK